MYHLCEYLSADMHTACDRKVVSFPITPWLCYTMDIFFNTLTWIAFDEDVIWSRLSSQSQPVYHFPSINVCWCYENFCLTFLYILDLWWTHQIVKRLRPTGSFERFLIHMVLLPIIAVTISFQSPLLGSRQKAENKVIRELSIRFGNIEKFTTNILLFHLPCLRIKSYTPIFGQVEL